MRRRETPATAGPTRLFRATLGAAEASEAEPLDLLLHQTGRALAWWGPHRQVRGGLLCADGPLLALPGLVAVATQPGSTALWLASRLSDGDLQLWSFDGQRLRPVRVERASGLHLGSHWMLAWRGSEATVTELVSGDPVPLPLGAREARARPWPEEPAASWCVGRSLVQQRDRGAPHTVGVASEPLRALQVGPQGAALAWGRSQLWAHAPGHGLLPLRMERPPPAACAFSPQGDQALVQTPDGVVLVDLRSGEPLDDRAEAVVAGWRCWEDPDGRRQRWLGRPESPPPPRRGAARSLPPFPPALPPGLPQLGLPLDGARPTPEGGWLCWQVGGLELELRPGTNPSPSPRG